jgi:hypothetical protein
LKKLTKKKKRIPTDIEILDIIYNSYYDEFTHYTNESPSRNTKIYLPIDISEVADKLKVDGDVVFGRLYYHLENKYGYKNEDDSKISFFALKAGNDLHCVNFPYLASVLAELRDKQKEYRTGTVIALFSLCISIVSLIVSLLVYI